MITVVGGTGRLGTALVPLLRASGAAVRVASRSGVVPAALVDLVDDVVRADVRDPATLEAVVRGSDVVVSAVHGLGSRERGVNPESVDHRGNVHLVDAAARAGADVVLVSVAGASPRGSELERAKWAAEVHLRGSGAPWTIVRATAYEELWTEILARSAARDGRPSSSGVGRTRSTSCRWPPSREPWPTPAWTRAPAARSSRCAGPGTSVSPTSRRPQCAPGADRGGSREQSCGSSGRPLAPSGRTSPGWPGWRVWMDTADLRRAGNAAVRASS